MIIRDAQVTIRELLTEFPAVAILGPRQVGKTTLADAIASDMHPGPVYLDLENPADQAKLALPQQYFELNQGRLMILDEIQRMPDLFPILRGTIDKRRKQGMRTGQFLILGSASLDLLKQSSESLAGRIAYLELGGLSALEVSEADSHTLWLRGGFPDSFLARNDLASFRWRTNFITTYLERDIPQIGPSIPATTLRKFWTMLAHQQGGQVNVAQLGANIDVSAPTAKRYLDLLEDLLLIRTLRPWSGNIGKRLVKSPKLYIRDSGITHALLAITTTDDLLANPVVGASWEGFVVENLISVIPVSAMVSYYRTSAGAEIDLVVEFGSSRIAIEVKRSMTPVLSRGFYHGCLDIQATSRFVVYPGKESFALPEGCTAVPVTTMMQILKQLESSGSSTA